MAAVGWLGFAALLWLRDRLGIDADFGLLKTLTYWIFFAAGYAWGEWKRTLEPGRPLMRWAPLLLYPLFAVPVLRAMPSFGLYGNSLAKLIPGLPGIGFSAALLKFAEPLARKVRLDSLGRLTLGVYCSQWLFLRVHFAEGVPGVLATFAFTIAASTALTWAITKVPMVRGVLLGEWARPRSTAA
jgi:hypothetical protein